MTAASRRSGMRPLLVCLLAMAPVTMAPVTFAPVALAQSTDVNAEARVFFDRGNELFEQAGRVSGRRQRRLLEGALQNYVSALRIVRSRNALFNAAVVLEQLQRPDEAFAYYREYLAIPGLTDDERTQGQTRIEGIRPQIAVVDIASTPTGVQVFVDRLDLAARGATPVEIAVPPGEHTLFFRHPHYGDAQVRVTAVTGETQRVRQALQANPVALTVRGEGRISIDGNPVEPGTHELPPGNYVLRLEAPGRDPVQRLVELRPGEPQDVRLVPGAAQEGILRITTNVPARVRVDSAEVGHGESVDASVEPGPHLVRVEAEGFEPWEGMVTASAGGTAQVRVTMNAGGDRPLGLLPHIALGVTGAAVIGFGVLAGLARAEHEDYKDACRSSDSSGCNTATQNDVENANLRADIVLGVAGALAITTLILYVLNRAEGGGTTADVQVGRNGAVLEVGGRF